MLGKMDTQQNMFGCHQQYLEFIGRESFYSQLANYRNQLFSDGDFKDFYHQDQGRTSVPPSQLAVALMLQCHDKVSDEEAANRAAYDLRWKCALHIQTDERPFTKSTMQEFRSKLIIRDKESWFLDKSVLFAKKIGYLKNKAITSAIDTTPVFGRGAVKDTFNLLADGIKQLIHGLIKASAPANKQSVTGPDWADEHGYSRYFSASIKGTEKLDWNNKQQLRQFLASIVADAERLLALTRDELRHYEADSSEHAIMKQSSELLARLLEQDIERSPNGEVAIKQEVAKDRVISVHDPEMRHGRKSARHRFNGHKAAVVVDTDTSVVLHTAVLAGNAPDDNDALAQIEIAEQRAGVPIEATIGDCSYNTTETRESFGQASRTLHTKVPAPADNGQLPKTEFQIDIEQKRITCPGEHTTSRYTCHSEKSTRSDKKRQIMTFKFDAATCRQCPLYKQCVKGKNGQGRTVRLHPLENELRQARAFAQTDIGRELLARRVVAEHRLARLIQLGARQSRYFGRKKYAFQLALIAAVANFTLIMTV